MSSLYRTLPCNRYDLDSALAGLSVYRAIINVRLHGKQAHHRVPHRRPWTSSSPKITRPFPLGSPPALNPLDGPITLLRVRKECLYDADQFLRCEINQSARIEQIGNIDEVGVEEFRDVVVFQPVRGVGDNTCWLRSQLIGRTNSKING